MPNRAECARFGGQSVVNLRCLGASHVASQSMCVTCSAAEAAGQDKPMQMSEFVAQFSQILPSVKLPPGYPPQRVFSDLDANKNRRLEPIEMRNIRKDVYKGIVDHKRQKNERVVPDRAELKKQGKERAKASRARAKSGTMTSTSYLCFAAMLTFSHFRADDCCIYGCCAGSKSQPDEDEMDIEQFFKRVTQRSQGENPRQVFAQVDKDESGGISRSELREYYKSTTQVRKDVNKRQGSLQNSGSSHLGSPSERNREIQFGVRVFTTSNSLSSVVEDSTIAGILMHLTSGFCWCCILFDSVYLAQLVGVRAPL